MNNIITIKGIIKRKKFGYKLILRKRKRLFLVPFFERFYFKTFDDAVAKVEEKPDIYHDYESLTKKIKYCKRNKTRIVVKWIRYDLESEAQKLLNDFLESEEKE